jgi:hypothetical protein
VNKLERDELVIESRVLADIVGFTRLNFERVSRMADLCDRYETELKNCLHLIHSVCCEPHGCILGCINVKAALYADTTLKADE